MKLKQWETDLTKVTNQNNKRQKYYITCSKRLPLQGMLNYHCCESYFIFHK